MPHLVSQGKAENWAGEPLDFIHMGHVWLISNTLCISIVTFSCDLNCILQVALTCSTFSTLLAMVSKSSWDKVHTEPDATYLFHFQMEEKQGGFGGDGDYIYLFLSHHIHIQTYNYWQRCSGFWRSAFSADFSTSIKVFMYFFKKSMLFIQQLPSTLSCQELIYLSLSAKWKKYFKCKTKNLTMYNSKCTSADRV